MPSKEILNRIRARKQAAIVPAVVPAKLPSKQSPPNSPLSLEPKVYKKEVFDTYILWRTIPLAIKNLSEPEREKLNLPELPMKLSTIRTKTQFCEEYNVDKKTLQSWDGKIDWTQYNAQMKSWMQNMTANWRMALYRKAMRTGNAQEVMALEKIINDYNEDTGGGMSAEIYVVDMERKIAIKALFKTNAHRRSAR